MMLDLLSLANAKVRQDAAELAVAEARRYGWGFLIIDQMPLLLSKYVWDNCRTLFVHRLANIESYSKARDALGANPVPGVSEMEKFPLAPRLPENMALLKRYTAAGDPGPAVGSTLVPRVKAAVPPGATLNRESDHRRNSI